MIYRCPKGKKNCEECLFVSICYDGRSLFNLENDSVVSEVELPRAVPISYESEDER